MSEDFMIFLDIETTGLEEVGGHILEIGFAKVALDFTVGESFSLLVGGEEYQNTKDFILNDFIKKMHGLDGSGLLNDLDVMGGYEPRTAENLCLEKLTEWGVNKKDKQPIFGSSVHFDRKWLNHHMFKLNDLFSYRNVDSSSDMEYLKKKYPEIWADIEADPARMKLDRHRVLPDIFDSVNLQERIDRYVFQAAVEARRLA